MWFFNRNRELAYLALEVAKMKRQVKILTDAAETVAKGKRPRLKKDGTLAKKVGRKRLTKKV